MPAEPDLASRLYVRLGRVVRSLRKEVGATSVGAGGMSALATLRTCGPMRASALAEVEGIAPASITRIVNGLESVGYVARTSDPSDGRAHLVGITEEGRALIETGTEVKTAALRARVELLTAAERAALEAALPVIEKLGVSEPSGREGRRA